MKCKKKTETNDLSATVLKNGTPVFRGNCAKCGTVKYRIASKADGGSLLNTLLTRLPMPEMHLALPKRMQSEYRPAGSFNDTGMYSFCGPFTKVQKRIEQGYRGVNLLDQACRQHDLDYAANSDVKDRNRADDVLANKAAHIVMDASSPEYEKQDGRLVTGLMAMKSRFGM